MYARRAGIRVPTDDAANNESFGEFETAIASDPAKVFVLATAQVHRPTSQEICLQNSFSLTNFRNLSKLVGPVRFSRFGVDFEAPLPLRENQHE